MRQKYHKLFRNVWEREKDPIQKDLFEHTKEQNKKRLFKDEKEKL